MPSIGVEIGKNALLGFPGARRWRTAYKLRRGYDDAKNDPAYPLGVFNKHRDAIETIRPVEGCRVLEIGPGGNVAAAALFVKAGAAEAVCADLYPWAAGAEALYDHLGIGGVLDKIRYEWPCTAEDAQFGDSSFDIIYSHAAYEHFRDPAQATKNIARMLAPGGVTTHQVDFRDHLDFRRPLDFLRHSDRKWRLATSNRMWWTNRWRASDLLDAFRAAGLTVIEARVTESVAVSATDATSFDARFQIKSLDDLGILGMFVVATRQ